MNSICLIDTSIFLNLLDVPSRNESKEIIFQNFQEYIEAGCIFLLPMATILETGNHIAQNGDGNIRRKTASLFVKAVLDAFAGEAPWRPMEFPTTQEMSTWLAEFPDQAGRNKTSQKLEGMSLGDFSIIQDFQKTCQKFAMSEVFIWSLDQDLSRYIQTPK